MSSARVKENIVLLLENIVKRSQEIEDESGSKTLLSIDLAMEDIRLLYRQMEQLRVLVGVEMSSSLARTSGSVLDTLPRSSPAQNSRPKAADEQEGEYRQAEPAEKTKPQAPPQNEPEAKGKTADTSEAQHTIDRQVPATPTSITENSEKAQPHQAQKPSEPQNPARETPEAQPTVQPQKAQEPKKTEEPAAAQNNKREERQQPVSSQHTERSNLPLIDNVEAKNKVLVGEKFTSSNNSVHERLAQIKDDKSIGARMQQKPVSNIKDAIGLNEKFLFINELFNGDLEAYNRSVAQLNSCASIHEAFEMLNQLTSDFSWDGQRSAETIDKFANIVQRRFM